MADSGVDYATLGIAYVVLRQDRRVTKLIQEAVDGGGTLGNEGRDAVEQFLTDRGYEEQLLF